MKYFPSIVKFARRFALSGLFLSMLLPIAPALGATNVAITQVSSAGNILSLKFNANVDANKLTDQNLITAIRFSVRFKDNTGESLAYYPLRGLDLDNKPFDNLGRTNSLQGGTTSFDTRQMTPPLEIANAETIVVSANIVQFAGKDPIGAEVAGAMRPITATSNSVLYSPTKQGQAAPAAQQPTTQIKQKVKDPDLGYKQVRDLLPLPRANFIPLMFDFFALLFAILFLVGIVFGGIQMITAGDDPEKFKRGTRTVLYIVLAIALYITGFLVFPLVRGTLEPLIRFPNSPFLF